MPSSARRMTESREKSESRRAKSRRAAPDVVDKRRAARRFNALLQGNARASSLDGRTEKRRARLLAELESGVARASKRALKPIDILLRVQDLLDIGEPIGSIRRACRPARAVAVTSELIEGLRTLQEAYAFRAEAYAFVGVDDSTLRAAGITPALSERPGVRAASPREATRLKRGGAA
jgi:hypothetical protein